MYHNKCFFQFITRDAIIWNDVRQILIQIDLTYTLEIDWYFDNHNVYITNSVPLRKSCDSSMKIPMVELKSIVDIERISLISKVSSIRCNGV